MAALILTGASAGEVAAATTHRIPRHCRSVPAVRLCAIHTHHQRVNQYRARLGETRLVYRYKAEREPHLRDWLVTYWWHRDQAAKREARRLTRSPWSRSWLSSALCIHGKEGSWTANTGNGYTGGMQFDSATWLANGGGRFASAAYLASPHDQLLVSYWTWQRRGWSPWPATSAACGL